MSSYQQQSEGGSPHQEHHGDIHGAEHQQLHEQQQQYLHQAHHIQQSYIPPDPNAVHTLSHMRDGYHESDSLLKVVDPMGFGDIGPGSPDGSPDRKRRRMNGEQQVKRHKYDVLKSFFRIYFKVDNQSMVLKDAIYNLYARKIPSDSRIARNAMYRHMWSFFKDDKISAFQSNYREYIKGVKLLTGQEPLNYEGFEKDLEVLQSIGVGNLFDFQEEELAKSPGELMSSPLPMSAMPQQPHSPEYLVKASDSSDDDIMRTIEILEQQSRVITNTVKDLRAKMVARKK